MCKVFYKKINSSVGASLAIALLLFLACTVVGTVVLTAASAVSGRAAELTFMDQRYHSVASAAALLEKELCGKEVTIERKKTIVTTETTYFEEQDDGSIRETGKTTDYDVTYQTAVNHPIDDSDKTLIKKVESSSTTPPIIAVGSGTDLGDAGKIPTGESFLTTMAVNLLFGDSEDVMTHKIECNTEAALTEYAFAESSGSSLDNYCVGTFALKHEANSIGGKPADSMSDYDAVCKYYLKKDGTLIFEITDNVTIPASLTGLEHYTLTLTLFPEFDETPLMAESQEEFEISSNGLVEKLTTTTTQTRTSTVKWKTTAQK